MGQGMNEGAKVADPAISGRQFVILSGREAPAGEGMPPVGPRKEIVDNLARCNTSPEENGSPDVLFGPGIRVELAPGQDPITQMLVTINEEEIGWLVLTRMIRQFGWKLVDPNTQRELNLQDED
jgi:hypothetical protein